MTKWRPADYVVHAHHQKRRHDLAAAVGKFSLKGVDALLQKGISDSDPQSSIVIATFITPIDATAEGQVIRTIRQPWLTLMKKLAIDPQFITYLTWRQVEEMVAASYEQAGYDEVILTPRSGDKGKDVIAIDNRRRIKVIDQVKAYGPDHKVSLDQVHSMLGVLSRYDSASKGVITTTSDFVPGVKSDPGIQRYIPTRLELRNGKEFLDSLNMADDLTPPSE